MLSNPRRIERVGLTLYLDASRNAPSLAQYVSIKESAYEDRSDPRYPIFEPALAYETETGAVMICDTQKKVERYVQVFNGNPRAAIRAVNTEENDPNACALVNVSYVQGPDVSMARSSSHAFRIVPIVVVSVNRSSGYAPVKPALFFTPVEIKELSV